MTNEPKVSDTRNMKFINIWSLYIYIENVDITKIMELINMRSWSKSGAYKHMDILDMWLLSAYGQMFVLILTWSPYISINHKQVEPINGNVWGSSTDTETNVLTYCDEHEDIWDNCSDTRWTNISKIIGEMAV